MGAEMTDTEVPVSEVAPCPDPGRQYVGWVNGRWQVRWSGGGSRATTLWAGKVIDDSHTGLGDADNDGAGLATEVESGAEMAGSESRADVAPKDESAGIAAAIKEERRRFMEEAEAVAALHASEARERKGLAGVAKSSAGVVYSEGGAASSGKIFKSNALEWESKMGRSGREADQVRSDRNGEAEVALPDVVFSIWR